MSQELNEFLTRKQKIDVMLKEQGWMVGDRTKIILEVDTKQSDFRAQNYKTVSETLKNDMESRYVDCLLLDMFDAPIAIIEAKRTSRDPILTAQKQAQEYADDIKAQTGKDVFIFMSNGYEIWFWDRESYGPRPVKGFFSQSDLERLRFQGLTRENLTDFQIDRRIVDRSKNVECTKRVLEHINKGNRKALIVMATGTGKTRVAMAIIDVLLKANRAQKVLFLADRKALRKQACDDGFKQFFPEESKSMIHSGVFNRNSRLYVSTIQTFMEIYNQKDSSGKYMISPGEFDVIISDEALTEADLSDLELTLNNPELYITEDVLQKVFSQNKGTLVQFIKNILGLYKFPDPKERIKDAFNTYIIENIRHYSADQLNFIRTVQTVFSRKKHIEYTELFDAPFTNFGINAPMPMFTENELNDFINICGVLEKEIYAEA